MAGGFVVTSGEFTNEARHFSEGREIQLINGRALQHGIRAQVAQTPVPLSTVNRPTPQRDEVPVQMAEHAVQPTPSCPLCHSPMVLRQARNGPAAGKQFFGCSRFGQTKCRGTRELV